MSFDMASTQTQQNTAQVAEKVMRRIEIAKVARNLQDCLAFASFKAQNGWQDRTLSTIEPEMTEKLARRKRPLPEEFNISDSSSTFSEEATSSSQPIHVTNPAESYAESRKRARAMSKSELERLGNHVELGHSNGMPYPSPLLDQARTPATLYPALQDSPMFDAPSASEDEDENAPPMQEPPSSSIVSSSPPRTPPPTRRNFAGTKQAGADLLLFLANSPRTPAVHVQHISSTTKDIPETPPHQHVNLPSSTIQTPGNFGLLNGTLNTPGNFNLSEFCNVTPSPAQAQFNRFGTPALSRTPCRLTRRSLNFEALAAPSPPARGQQAQGLALELGQALSRQ